MVANNLVQNLVVYFITRLGVVVANAVPVVGPARDHPFSAKTDTVEILDRIGVAIGRAKPSEEAKPLRRILGALHEILVEIVNEVPRPRIFEGVVVQQRRRPQVHSPETTARGRAGPIKEGDVNVCRVPQSSKLGRAVSAAQILMSG